METIKDSETGQDFIEQIETVSHANLSRCWHCQSCSNGCPLSGEMDVLPNAVIRMIQFGMTDQVLNCSTIWLCVGCNTCSTECPNAVDMAAIMDALRQMAIRNNHKIAEPGILAFHEKVLESISKYGRTHKLEIMMKYKISEKDFFSDIDLGLKMLSKRKLDLMPSRVKHQKEIEKLFELAGEL